MINLRIHPAASNNIQTQALYYENEATGLGVSFLEEIDRTVTQITRMPLSYPIRHSDIRICILVRFPFSILYRIGKTELVVLAVRHHARDKEYGMNRK